MWEYNYTDELYHYGVLGMKWGKRKARREEDIERTRKENINSVNDTIRTIKAKKDKIHTKLNNHEITKKQADRKLKRLDKKQHKQENFKKEIKDSKYGKTSYQLLGEMMVNNARIQIASNLASKVAIKRGNEIVASIIGASGGVAELGNTIDKTYKILTNNRKR